MSSKKQTYEELLEELSILKTEISILKNQHELLTNDSELIIWGTNTAVWDWNYKTGFVKFSDKKAEMLGYNPADIEPNVYAFTSMIHPDDYQSTMDNMRNLLSGKSELYEVEYRIKAKNGHWKWFFDKGKIAERDIDNKPLRIIGIVNDITDKKNALIEIKENEEKHRKDLLMLHLIFESPIDIIIFSLDNNYCYSSFTKFHKETIKNIWGVDIEIGMNMLEIISNQEDRKKAKINFDKSLNGEYFVLTEEYGDKDLYRTFYENYYCPVKNEENVIIGVSVFVIDITFRKQIEAELVIAKEKVEESKERHKFLFDNTIQGVVYQNATGEIIYANKSAERILGLNIDQMQGRLSIDASWRSIHDDGSDYPGKSHPAMISLKTGKPINDEIMGVFNPIIQDYTWIKINSIPKFLKDKEKAYMVFSTFEDITEIRRATHELIKAKEKAEENELKYRLIAENTSDGILVIDKNNQIQFVSPSYIKLNGYTEKEELLQNAASIYNLIHPEDREDLFANIFGAIKEKKEELIYTYRAKHKNGHYYWREDNAKFNYDKDGNYLNTYVICRDITERKKREQELLIAKERAEESENLFRIFIEHSSSGETLHDTSGKLLVASPSIEKITGYSNHDFINKKITLNDICDNTEKEHCRFVLNEAIEGKNFHDILIKILTPARVVKYLNVTINQIFLENSERYGFRMSITDITEKKEAEKLAKSLLKAVESTQASVFILNSDFEIEYINPFFSTHTGYNQNEIIGNKYISFHSSVQQNQNYNSIYELLKKGNTWEGEILKEKKDKSVFIEQVTISPIKNEHDKISQFVGVGTDITLQKELDKKIVQTIIQTEERERERFARDLHDGIGPTLSVAKMYIQCLSNPNSKMSQTEIGSSTEELLLEAQRSVRQISYNLSPLILQSFGLIEALKSFTSKLEESSDMKSLISSNWHNRLNSIEETVLYRVLCECINNTIKHASASEIQIEFLQSIDSMNITYSDNGKGFDYKEVIKQKIGSGFLNIQSRLKIINATFDVQSSTNSGTKIIICIDKNPNKF